MLRLQSVGCQKVLTTIKKRFYPCHFTLLSSVLYHGVYSLAFTDSCVNYNFQSLQIKKLSKNLVVNTIELVVLKTGVFSYKEKMINENICTYRLLIKTISTQPLYSTCLVSVLSVSHVLVFCFVLLNFQQIHGHIKFGITVTKAKYGTTTIKFCWLDQSIP